MSGKIVCSFKHEKRPKFGLNFQTWIIKDCPEIQWRLQSTYQIEPNLYCQDYKDLKFVGNVTYGPFVIMF